MKAKLLTDNHDNDTNEDRLASTQLFTNETGRDSSDETTDFVDRHNQRNDIGTVVCLEVDAKGLGEGSTVDKATHQTIVEADKKKTKTGQGGYCVEKGIALELNRHGEKTVELSILSSVRVVEVREQNI